MRRDVTGAAVGQDVCAAASWPLPLRAEVDSSVGAPRGDDLVNYHRNDLNYHVISLYVVHREGV